MVWVPIVVVGSHMCHPQQAAQQQPDHGQVEHRLGGGRQVRVVLAGGRSITAWSPMTAVRMVSSAVT
jgi:hypothetical protein